MYPTGNWCVRAEMVILALVVKPDNLFYLTGRGTPLNPTLARWRFKLGKIESRPGAGYISLKQLQPSRIYW